MLLGLIERCANSYYKLASPQKGAAGLLLVDTKNGMIFLARRSNKVDAPGMWSVVGGGIEHGESALEAAKRETTEEMGSMPEISDVLDSTVFKDGNFTYTTFVCKVSPHARKNWQPRMNGENDKIGWFKLNNLPDKLHPGLEFTLKDLKRKHHE